MSRRYYKPLSIRRSERKAKRKLLIVLIVCLALCYLLIFHLLPTLIGGLTYLNKRSVDKAEDPTSDLTLAPPVLNIPYEATNSASIKVNGYSLPDSKVEIYLEEQIVSEVETNSDGSFSSGFIDLNLGTNNLSSKAIDSIGKKSLASKTIRLIYDNSRPKLEIKEPEDNKEIIGGDKKVKVAGMVDVADEAIVTVQGGRVIINADGNFSVVSELSEGENEIIIEAIDKAGNLTTIRRKVTYKP